MCLNRSNVSLDRKILADLAVNEPFSFKAIVEEVTKQNNFKEFETIQPRRAKMRGMMYEEALQKGKLRAGGPPTEEELKEIEALLIPKGSEMYGLRFPERDSKSEADYMRLSYIEEDAQFLKEQERKTITLGEQKKLPREVLTDNWEEDMGLYKHKRKDGK